jgi:hypothetical protein
MKIVERIVTGTSTRRITAGVTSSISTRRRAISVIRPSRAAATK